MPSVHRTPTLALTLLPFDKCSLTERVSRTFQLVNVGRSKANSLGGHAKIRFAMSAVHTIHVAVMHIWFVNGQPVILHTDLDKCTAQIW